MLPSGNLFYKTYENFINICENCSSDFARHRDKLNQILNELNSVDQKLIQLLDAKRLAENLISVLINIPIAEDTVLVKTFCLTNELINKHSVSIPNKTLEKTLHFLISFITEHKYVGVCDALQLMQTLIKNQDRNETESELTDVTAKIIRLLVCLMRSDGFEKSASCRYDGYSVAETKMSVVFCLETILANIDKLPDIAAADELFIDLRKILFDLIYNLNATDQNYCLLMRSALHSCQYIGMSNRPWCTEHVGDLLGACTATMLYGLPGIPVLPPQRIQSSQQALQNLSTTSNASAGKKGGKVIKGRKPRQTPQYKNRKNIKGNDNQNTEDTTQSFGQSVLFEYAEERFTISTFTASDSDASDNETNRSTRSREKEAKLRLAALSLICTLAKNVDRKTFFGYWHCLFPSEELSQNTVALLNCVLRDSNQRCRITALQATSLILYGTKLYLSQAEVTTKPPSSFTPFSVALGNRIVVLYSTLTQALAGESSLPVLTQILKCLAVLVQSTSFQKLQNTPGLIKGFVVYIRRLVHHKDPTVKVAALIVMEFLLSGSEITNEISESVGLFKLKPDENRRVHDFGEDEVVELEESSLESDCDEDEIGLREQTQFTEAIISNSSDLNMSWLLQIALENLGVTVRNYITPKQSSTSMQVRHQCLQIILTMAPHFIWIKPHLILLSQALENTFLDDVASVRQRAARCLDVITHSINAYLLSQSANNAIEFEQDIENALLFWMKILQSITMQLQDNDQNVVSKSIFCDVLSNIGVNIYERLPRDKQIQIISLLSGLSLGDDESIVRASAVRALAIFVLFPSLRDDICFVENTSEAILKIISDDNLAVQIKASWAMANITDALVTNIVDTHAERISNDLLLRLFDLTETLCQSNDKVRTNAARILGNLLRLITAEHLKLQKWQTKCFDAINRLIDQAKLHGGSLNMKVKWNACYAIGNFLKNPVIFDIDQKTFEWQESIYKTLCDIVVNCTNFKVRINGAAALAVPKTRSNYGKHYNDVWNALLVGLYQANCLTDYNEYNHRDNLLDQLCITISHLILLLTPDDLHNVENILLQHHDSTKNNWIRVINRMVPEKSANLLMAHLHLENFSAWNAITPEQSTSLQRLLSCFVSITEYS